MIARPEPEGERDRRDEDEREEDLAEPRAQLPPAVEPPDPEHEHGDDRQERQPVRLGVPEDSPQRRPLAEIEHPEDQRDEDAEDEADEVDRHQGGHAGEPAPERDESGA